MKSTAESILMTFDKNVISFDTFHACYVLTASIHGIFKAYTISVRWPLRRLPLVVWEGDM